MVVKSMFTYLVVKKCYSPRRLLAVSHQILNTLNNRNTVINTRYKSVLAINQLKISLAETVKTRCEEKTSSIQASFTNYNPLLLMMSTVSKLIWSLHLPLKTRQKDLLFFFFTDLLRSHVGKIFSFSSIGPSFSSTNSVFFVGLPMALERGIDIRRKIDA